VIIRIIYGWSRETPQHELVDELDINGEVLCEWFNFVRDICGQWIADNPPRLGGFDVDIEPITVEVDESVYHKRKYNVGEYRPTQWVLGGVDRKSKVCFLRAVPDCTAATLLPILEELILPGSRVITDGWAAYADILGIGGGVFSHDVIIHAHNFVNPVDSSVHTQRIEGLWKDVKKKLCRQCGTSNELFTTYLDKEMWRNNYCQRKNVFLSILRCICHQYPL
jgi:hypothetical protein